MLYDYVVTSTVISSLRTLQPFILSMTEFAVCASRTSVLDDRLIISRNSYNVQSKYVGNCNMGEVQAATKQCGLHCWLVLELKAVISSSTVNKKGQHRSCNTAKCKMAKNKKKSILVTHTFTFTTIHLKHDLFTHICTNISHTRTTTYAHMQSTTKKWQN